ncbi:Tn3 family transposase [Xanthomonas oryzae]|uniref:Tn3 family transposase n=1 Tax=Xanthomonas oryzae TaxID=347 RepID=UPI000AB441D9
MRLPDKTALQPTNPRSPPSCPALRRQRPDQVQEKAVKYNDLVSNAVIFYNVVEQTRIMKALMRQGWKITREDVAFLSPYVTSHVKRFGDYLIDVEAIPEPYEIELVLVA